MRPPEPSLPIYRCTEGSAAQQVPHVSNGSGRHGASAARLRPADAYTGQNTAGGKLSFSLIGGFSLEYDGRPVDLRNRKAQALLAYLTLTPNVSATREQVAGLLWGDSPEFQARSSLRQLLRQLRQAFDELGAPALEITRDRVRLDRHWLAVDVWEMLESVEQTGSCDLILRQRHVAESLLTGYEDLDGAFRSWLLVQRQNLQDRIVLSLEARLAEIGEEIPLARLQEVKSLAIGLSNLDQTHEGACRRLMQVSAVEGDISGALRRYNALWNLLDSEYDMEPSEATQKLVVLIKSGQFRVPERPVAAVPAVDSPVPATIGPAHTPRLTRPRLIVGSFGTPSLGADGEPGESSRYDLASGIRHQLIASLVRFREWSVVNGARGEVEILPPESGQPQYLVDVTCMRSNKQVQLVLTLSDQISGEFLWGEEHATDLERWFETQRLIVRRMAIALNVHISADRLRRVLWQPPEAGLSVYDRWLQGEALTQVWRLDNRRQAVRIFEDIVAEVPDFSPAHFGIANFHNVWTHFCPGQFRTTERSQEALSHAKAAVRLDPRNCRAHLCAAWSYAMNRQFDQAELSYQMAYELNENDPWTLISSTLGMAFCGHHELALERAQQARELGLIMAPLHWGYQAVTRFLGGDYEGCIACADRTQDVIYNFPAWKTAALAHLGHLEEARSEWRHFAGLVSRDWHGERAANGSVPGEAIANWLMAAFPIRYRRDWERLRAGLAAAGVPVHAATFVDPRSH